MFTLVSVELLGDSPGLVVWNMNSAKLRDVLVRGYPDAALISSQLQRPRARIILGGPEYFKPSIAGNRTRNLAIPIQTALVVVPRRITALLTRLI